jgi:hypothetical protein
MKDSIFWDIRPCSQCSLLATCYQAGFLLGFNPRLWRWRLHVPPKRLFVVVDKLWLKLPCWKNTEYVYIKHKIITPLKSDILILWNTLIWRFLFANLWSSGCTTWFLNLKKGHRFRVCKESVLRWISALKSEKLTTGWRKLYRGDFHKSEAIPVAGCECPQGCETSRLPHFLDNRPKDGCKFLSLRAGRPLPIRRFLVLISIRGWIDHRAIVRLEGLGQLKKSNDLIGNLTRYLPACSIVPQPTTPPRVPWDFHNYFFIACGF